MCREYRGTSRDDLMDVISDVISYARFMGFPWVLMGSQVW